MVVKTLTPEQKAKADRQEFSQNSIIKIRNTLPKNSPYKGVIRVLSQFYRNAPDSLIKSIPAVNKRNRNEMNAYVKKQFDLLKNQRVPRNVNSGAARVTTLDMDINKLHDFFLFLWLDMRHDFKKLKVDFDTFLKGPIVDIFASRVIKNKNGVNSEQTIDWKWDRSPRETLNMKTCRDFGIIGTNRGGKYAYPGDIADQLLKDKFVEMWSKRGNTEVPSTIEVPKTANSAYYESLRKDNKPVYISFDSENSHYLTAFISASKTTGTKANGTQGVSYLLKRLYTLANLMDPGRLGGAYATAGSSVDEVFTRLFNKTNPSWAFKINAQPYIWKFGEYFTIEIVYEGKTTVKCKLNNKVLNLGITKREAAGNNTTNGNPIAMISKTFGDLNQILTVSTLRKSNQRVVSGTQDRAFVGMTGFIQRDLFDILPQIIYDTTRTGEDYIRLYGMQEYYKNNAVKTKTGANSVTPTPKRNSQNRRSIVNGVSSSGGSTVGGNNNNNEVQSSNRGRVNLNQRLREKGINNAKRIALLNKYNKRTLNFNGVISEANQIIKNKGSNPAEMNLGAAIMSGEGLKPVNNKNAMIRNLRAQLARAQAALVESTQAATAAANAANAATKKLQQTRNARNAQAAKNAAAKNAAANKAAKNAAAKAKRLARALKQLQTSATLPGAQQNQGVRRSTRRKF